MTVFKLERDRSGRYIWINEEISNKKQGSKKYDPTLDQYIKEKGGIKSHLDNKVYISKASYLQHLKNNNHHLHE